MSQLYLQIAKQNRSLTFLQLQELENLCNKLLDIHAKNSDIAYFQKCLNAIGQSHSYFLDNYIHFFRNSKSNLIKFHISRLLNQKFNNFYNAWSKFQKLKLESIFQIVVDKIIQILEGRQNYPLKEELLKQLNKTFSYLYRFHWNNKLKGVLPQICNPDSNEIKKLSNNLKIIKIILEDVQMATNFMLSEERKLFIKQIKIESELILKNLNDILRNFNKYFSVIEETVNLLPFVLKFIDSSLFLTNYSFLINSLISIYLRKDVQNIKTVRCSLLEALQIIMSYTSDKLGSSYMSKIDFNFAKNLSQILEYQNIQTIVTKSKFRKPKPINPFSNGSSQRKSNFFKQNNKINIDFIKELIQNCYCQSNRTQIDQNILQVIKTFLIVHSNIEVQVFNQTGTIKQNQEDSNTNILKKFMENLIRFLFTLGLKLQNENKQNIVQTQRTKLLLLETIKYTLNFSACNQISIGFSSQMQICSILICNLSTCPSYFWNSYCTAQILPKINLEDQSNFYEYVDQACDMFPQIWSKLYVDSQYVQEFVIQKLNYFLNLNEQDPTQKPQRSLGINRIVWGVKHLMDTSHQYYKIAQKVHKILSCVKMDQTQKIKTMATIFCESMLSLDVQYQNFGIQRLLNLLDSNNANLIQFYLFILRQFMQKIHGVEKANIELFLKRFQALIFYQDKNQRNLIIFSCYMEFIRKYNDPDIQSLNVFNEKIIEICFAQEKQYPERKGFIKIQCLTWQLKQLFSILDQIQVFLKNKDEDLYKYSLNNQQWNHLICIKIMKKIESQVMPKFEQFKQIQIECFQFQKIHEGPYPFQYGADYKKYEKFQQVFIDFIIVYSRTWKIYFKKSFQTNSQSSKLLQQLKVQESILMNITNYYVQLINCHNVDLLNPKIFKLFTCFIQFYCDSLIQSKNFYPKYKQNVNILISAVYSYTNQKINMQTQNDFEFKLNYYYFFERLFTNENIFCILYPQTVNFIVGDILLKICLDDNFAVIQTGIFIMEKLFIKITNVDIQFNLCYQEIKKYVVKVSQQVFYILFLKSGQVYFDQLTILLLHLIQIIVRTEAKLFQNSSLNNGNALRILFQETLYKEFFSTQHQLPQQVKNLLMILFNPQQIQEFRENVKDLMIFTNSSTNRAKISMEDSYC